MTRTTSQLSFQTASALAWTAPKEYIEKNVTIIVNENEKYDDINLRQDRALITSWMLSYTSPPTRRFDLFYGKSCSLQDHHTVYALDIRRRTEVELSSTYFRKGPISDADIQTCYLCRCAARLQDKSRTYQQLRFPDGPFRRKEHVLYNHKFYISSTTLTWLIIPEK